MTQGLPREDAPLVARCQACGGAVPVVISAASLVCTFCGSEAPLPPPAAARVAALQAKLGRATAREQQLVGKQARQARGDTTGFVLASMSLVFLLVGAMAYFTPPSPVGVSAREVTLGARRAREIGDPAAVRFWVVWGLSSGWLLAVVLVLLAALGMRRVARFALPEAPAAPGRPPRCRCCGAELPEAGAVRRCPACRVDHLVDGERFQRRAATLDEALGRLERQLDLTLARRYTAASRAMAWAGSLPVALSIGVLIAGAVLGRTWPGLWAVPAALMLLALALGVALRRLPCPSIRAPDEARPGDGLWVGDRLRTVVAELSGFTPPGYGSFRLDFRLLARGPGAEPLEALAMESTGDGALSSRLWRLERGGDAALPPEVTTKAVFGGTLRGDGSPRWSSSETVWTCLGPAGPGPEPESVRVFRGPRPAGRETPAFTLWPDRALGEDELLWAGPTVST